MFYLLALLFIAEVCIGVNVSVGSVAGNGGFSLAYDVSVQYDTSLYQDVGSHFVKITDLSSIRKTAHKTKYRLYLKEFLKNGMSILKMKQRKIDAGMPDFDLLTLMACEYKDVKGWKVTATTKPWTSQKECYAWHEDWPLPKLPLFCLEIYINEREFHKMKFTRDCIEVMSVTTGLRFQIYTLSPRWKMYYEVDTDGVVQYHDRSLRFQSAIALKYLKYDQPAKYVKLFYLKATKGGNAVPVLPTDVKGVPEETLVCIISEFYDNIQFFDDYPKSVHIFRGEGSVATIWMQNPDPKHSQFKSRYKSHFAPSSRNKFSDMQPEKPYYVDSSKRRSSRESIETEIPMTPLKRKRTVFV